MAMSWAEAIEELADDVDDIRDPVLREVLVRVKQKTAVDTGVLHDSWFIEDDGIYSSDDREKVLANEYGTIHMSGTAPVRRTMRELPQIIRKIRRRRR